MQFAAFMQDGRPALAATNGSSPSMIRPLRVFGHRVAC